MTEEEKIFNEFNQSDEFNDLRINIVDTIFNMVQAKTTYIRCTQQQCSELLAIQRCRYAWRPL